MNKYLVIKPSGEISDAEEYLKAKDINADFRRFVEVEALGRNKSDESAIQAERPKYLAHARKLGFAWEENADAGFVQHDYKAALVMRLVKEYARELVGQIGFPIFEVHGSNMFDMSHPVVKAYAHLYGDRLFQFKSGKKDLVMSYDASYPQFNLSAKYSLNHKQLPFAHFSIADCYRHEQSGEVMLLHRQRRFYMPDLHPYFKNVAEAFEWYPKIEAPLVQAAAEVKREYQVVIEVSSPVNWEKYRAELEGFAKRLKKDILVSILDDGKDRYWIINVDYKIIDKLSQPREIGCIQIDVNNAERLGIEYVDSDGSKKNPVIIHAAVPGGIERYIYMLLDNFEESFPLWLYPAQIRLIPVRDEQIGFCEKLAEQCANSPVRIEIDDRNAGVSKKIKQAHDDSIPFPIVIGEREEAEKRSDELAAAVERVVEASKGKPFIELDYPKMLSMQVR